MEPGTFTQLYVQTIFSPKMHCPIVNVNHQKTVFKFMTGTLNSMGHKALAVNGMHDHVHCFFGLKPSISISDTVKEIKRASSTFIKEQFEIQKFYWQKGYGAFSYSRDQIDTVVKYIINQREHHKNETFREEYIRFLEEFEIEYDPKYLFEFID